MDGRPPGNTGCCRLFVVSVFPCLPSPLAPGPSRTASRTCRWPLAPHRAQSRRLPSSPSQVGWPGRPTPAADLGCLRAARQPLGFLSASRKPEERRGRRRGGLCLGLPWQASGNSGRGRGPSPTPRRTLAGNLAVSRRRGRTTHTHTHTHTKGLLSCFAGGSHTLNHYCLAPVTHPGARCQTTRDSPCTPEPTLSPLILSRQFFLKETTENLLPMFSP